MESTKKKKSKLFSTKYLLYDLVKITAALPGLLFFRPKWLYENEAARRKTRGGALVICNHTGIYDPILLQYAVWYRRHHFVCLESLLKSKGGWFLKRVLCIPINRENFNIDSFREITGHLQNGEVVSMFPEGHLNGSADGSLDSFKSGMILMAVRSAVPILSVYVRKPAHWYNRLRLAVGEPVDVTGLYGDRPSFTQIEELARLIYEKENRLKQLCDDKGD